MTILQAPRVDNVLRLLGVHLVVQIIEHILEDLHNPDVGASPDTALRNFPIHDRCGEMGRSYGERVRSRIKHSSSLSSSRGKPTIAGRASVTSRARHVTGAIA
ncbi:MAG: hypothetical protein JWQ16_1725 [Novosphingobium sp.]|nr:hypothetical protein [Novosphingobium sp.]